MISNKGGKNDTIKIQPEIIQGIEIIRSSQELYFSKSLNPFQSLLWGWVNPSEVVFSGNEDNYRGFIEVPPFKKVTFQNFTIRQMFNGSDDKSGGAAIAYRRNNSDLLVDNMRFINNRVHQSSYHSGGGAIYMSEEILEEA